METPSSLFFIVFILFFGLTITELICYWLWVPFYFRIGIPIFSQEIQPLNLFQLNLDIPQLEKQLGGFWGKRVVFKEVQPNEYLFRHNFTSRNPIIGQITFDTIRGVVVVKGNLYWSLLFLPLLILFFIPYGAPLIVLFIFAFIILVNLAIQRNTYQKVAQAIQEAVGKTAVK